MAVGPVPSPSGVCLDFGKELWIYRPASPLLLGPDSAALGRAYRRSVPPARPIGFSAVPWPHLPPRVPLALGASQRPPRPERNHAGSPHHGCRANSIRGRSPWLEPLSPASDALLV